jgi:hypothetical protein
MFLSIFRIASLAEGSRLYLKQRHTHTRVSTHTFPVVETEQRKRRRFLLSPADRLPVTSCLPLGTAINRGPCCFHTSLPFLYSQQVVLYWFLKAMTAPRQVSRIQVVLQRRITLARATMEILFTIPISFPPIGRDHAPPMVVLFFFFFFVHGNIYIK